MNYYFLKYIDHSSSSRMSSASDEQRSSCYVSKTAIQEMLDEQALDLKTDLKTFFDQKLSSLLEPIRQDIFDLKQEIDEKEAVISDLKSELESVKLQNQDLVTGQNSLIARLEKLESFQSSATKSFLQLEEKTEERTNRQLRQTIVVKGLPEKKKESWADTRNALAKHVAKAYNMDFPKAYQMFERVHQGGGDGFGEKKKGKRDIFALCTHWDDSEKLVLGSNKAHKAMPKKDRISFDYKYGPLTNARRDHFNFFHTYIYY